MTRHRRLIITLAVVVLTAAGVGGQRYTPSVGEVGKVDFQANCLPESLAHIERGAALLHSFWYEEAQKAFAEAYGVDADCAMAAWGEAMTFLHPLWDPPSKASLDKGLEAARRAKSIGGRTPREQGFIDAALAMYEQHDTVPHAQRIQRYSTAMEKLSRAQPSDPNVTAFYALSLLSLVGGDTVKQARQAAAVLEHAFGPAPDHPGAAHYLIHAYDNPQDAARGVPAADKYAGTAPAIPHALHMPSHIYTRLGLWPKVVASNTAAWKASDTHVGSAMAHGGLRDYHSLQWLHYGHLQQGEFSKAAETIAIVRKHADAEPAGASGDYVSPLTYRTDMMARDALERGDWKAAMDVPEGGTQRSVDATRWFARGVGAARAAWPGGQGPLIAVAREAALKLDELAAKQGRKGLVELQRLGVLAAIAAAQEEQDELTLLLTQAMSLELAIQPPGQPVSPIVPLHELAGDLFLVVHRYPDARRAYEASLARYPGRARSLHGLARACAKSNAREAARTAYEQLLEQWKTADPDRPEIAEAKAFLAEGR